MQSTMRLEWRDPRTLVAHVLNWKIHPSNQREAYAELKKDVGWAGALLLNEQTDHLLDGHMRLEDSLENNEDTVPVLVINVPVEKELRILAYLDQIGTLFRVDQSRLNALQAAADARLEAVDSLLHKGGDDDDADDEPEGWQTPGLPEGGVSLVLGESYNYVVLVFKTDLDWTMAQDHFEIQRVKCAFNSSIGQGRVIDGSKYLSRMKALEQSQWAAPASSPAFDPSDTLNLIIRDNNGHNK